MRNTEHGTRNRPIRITAILLAALMISSCGYRMTPVGSVIPEGAKTIAIPVFLNNTNEPYVDTVLTQEVVHEFLSDGRLKVVDLEDADLILRCKIMKFDLVPVAYVAPANKQGSSYVQTYSARINVTVSLEDARTKKVLLQGQDIDSIFFSNYAVTLGDITATKLAKEATIRDASRNIASSIRSRVLEWF